MISPKEIFRRADTGGEPYPVQKPAILNTDSLPRRLHGHTLITNITDQKIVTQKATRKADRIKKFCADSWGRFLYRPLPALKFADDFESDLELEVGLEFEQD